MSETKRDNQADPIVIVSVARTPMAAFQGDFATLTAHATRRHRDRGRSATRGPQA